jgi:porin
VTQRNLQTLQSASGIEANATTRLWELWNQQTLLDGKVDVKVGHQRLTVLAGVFDGNPAPGAGDPQKLNAHGTNCGVGNGALFIGEVQYALNPPPANPVDAASPELPGTYKLGFWYNTNHFDDQRFDNTGLSLANPASSVCLPAIGRHSAT